MVDRFLFSWCSLMRTLSRRDLEDYILGAGILGCGGGGGAEWGMSMVEDALKKGLEFRLAEISELPKERRLCILSGVGGGVSKEDRERVAAYLQRFPRTRERRVQLLRRVAKELADYIGEEFCAYIASETGPGNGILPMYLNAIEGKPCVDGDCCGRAKPEIGISLTNVAEIPVTPLAMVTPFEEVVILKSAVDDYRAEDITRFVAVASGGGVTAARCPATVEEYEKGIVPGQVSRCIRIGAAVREAREKGRDPLKAFQEEPGVYKIFEGTVSSFEVEGRRGFHWGEWHIEGADEFKGKRLRVWFKNENLISWLDGEPYAMCPDLICIVDSETCDGLSNFRESGAYNGRRVTVFGVKAHERWRTPRGIEVFGPKHFGFDIEYIPLEELL
ncbi:hypothetical protein DRO56_00195 [Candidatus Bathyarchaeota archaeon]|nr:MAG: hypothetical protein DRO56_00195 [Candidatus Bathyarchaeota archaeon]